MNKLYLDIETLPAADEMREILVKLFYKVLDK